MHIDVAHHPERIYRIDRFHVPAAVRGELETAMQESLAFLRTLPGFLGHVAFVQAAGDDAFVYVTLAMWAGPAAAEEAGAAMRAHQQQIGFDLAATLARWGVQAERGNYTAPPALQATT